MHKSKTRICFIFNPAADRNRSTRNIAWLRDEISRRWQHYEIVITKKLDSLSDLAKKKSKEFDVIVACGGDGTVSHVINGIVNTGAVLGVLPIGSGNDFVKSLGLKRALPDCIEILYREHTSSIDLIRYDGDVEGWCANTLGMGLDGWANYYAHQIKKLKGQAVYFLGALRSILNFRGAEMQLNSPEMKISGNYLMITACNGKWEGGSFFVSPDADMRDGIMNILTIEKLPVFLLIRYLLQFHRGPTPSMKGIKTICCKSAEFIASKPLAVHRDGEHLGTNIQHLRLKVEKNILQVIIPDSY